MVYRRFGITIVNQRFFSFQLLLEEKLAKMVSLLLIVWFLAWTPYALMCLWIMFFNARGLSPAIGLIPLLACKTSAGANAMLYGMRYTSTFCNIKPLIQFR